MNDPDTSELIENFIQAVASYVTMGMINEPKYLTSFLGLSLWVGLPLEQVPAGTKAFCKGMLLPKYQKKANKALRKAFVSPNVEDFHSKMKSYKTVRKATPLLEANSEKMTIKEFKRAN